MFPGFPRTAVAAAFVLAGLLLLPSPMARAQEPPKPPAPPVNLPANVTKAIADMVAAHQALTSYSATVDISLKNPEATITAHSDVVLAKPGNARVAAKTTMKAPGANREFTRTIISDGKDMIGLDTSEPTVYRKVPAQPAGKNLTVALKNSGSIYFPLLGMLLEDPAAKTKILPPNATGVTLKTGQKLGGEEVSVISADLPADDGKVTLQLFIGKKDNLLRRVLLNAKEGDATTTIMETYSNIKINPTVPAETFLFTPAPNQKLLASEENGPAPAAKPETKPDPQR